MNSFAHSEYDRIADGLHSMLGAEWKIKDSVRRGVTWRVCEHAAGGSLPDQGWKIHVSAAAVEAAEMLKRVLPLIGEARLTFKLPARLDQVSTINSGGIGSTQLGKIVTIIAPSAAEAIRLARELETRWPRSKGPRVPSDVTLNPGSAVSLRYGILRQGQSLRDSVGRYYSGLLAPDGTVVPDQRTEDGQQPDFAEPLNVPVFRTKASDPMEPLEIGRDCFLPFVLLSESPKGRTFIALNQDNGDMAVVKTANAGVGGDQLGNDAVSRLENEFKVLSFLARRSAAVPAPLNFARDENGAVLALQSIEGESLDSVDPARRNGLLSAIAETVAELHDQKVAHRDLKMANVLMTEAGSLHLIDFEMAAPFGTEKLALGGTFGHIAPEGATLPVSEATDCYSLGATLAHAVLDCDPATLPENAGRLVGLCHLIGRSDVAQVVADLTRRNPADRISAREAVSRLRDPKSGSRAQADRMSGKDDLAWAARACVEAGRATRSFVVEQGPGKIAWSNRHFESDYLCEGLNLGAAGIILGLMTLAHAFNTDEFDLDVLQGADWLAAQPCDLVCHGIFNGNAAVSLALGIAGKRYGRTDLIEKAKERLRVAAENVEESDLFAGIAGVIWAACLLGAEDERSWSIDLIEQSSRTRPHGLLEKLLEIENPFEMTGAAHGTSGIAMALAFWGRQVGNQRAIESAQAYFRRVYRKGKSEDGTALMKIEGPGRADTRNNNWCHGTAGYLWCLLQAFPEADILRVEKDWAAQAFLSSTIVSNSTYCHGVAGQLELVRLMSRFPEYRVSANLRHSQLISVARALQLRRQGMTVWSSEDPKVVTPDLWVGFLAPATSLALSFYGESSPILSTDWLKRISRS